MGTFLVFAIFSSLLKHAMEQVYVGIFSLIGSLIGAHYYSKSNTLQKYQLFSTIGAIVSVVIFMYAMIKYFNIAHLKLLREDQKQSTGSNQISSNINSNSIDSEDRINTQSTALEENGVKKKESLIIKKELHS